MSNSIRTGRGLGLLALVLAGACTDSSPLLPSPEGGTESMARVECTVDVRSSAMQCVTVEPAQARLGVTLNKIIGGQNRYIKLASSGTRYDPGTEILSTNVTVQNLLQSQMGTDGVTPEGIKVFFVSGPAVTSGTGTVSIENPAGTTTIYGPEQEYFLYNEVLDPYEISQSQEWRFNAPSSVSTFTFSVYVDAQLTNETNLFDAAWVGRVSNDWFVAENWSKNVVPGESSIVTVLADSAVRVPTLTRDSSIAALNVGPATTLDLNTHSLQIAGFVNAPGEIIGGRIIMTGSAAKLSGFVPSLNITGATALQGPVKTTGAVAVQGTLTVTDQTLTIRIP
ncbi:hypothetical protein [Longimicrobium terrae]|uniref:Uncharacterized protein n=1 Tax=Longimicrobium terrae TaxID=1639882 RepID=A0A841H442_9BACT|nr:hypothetical protein [Longimicrobium terrae]MBB4638651.1 hypothetical protein [Longimicrobium terrae]MBB6072891.1 hypothetical protein [Longimicrobium terrae]NNC31504.1 hypothetical protein [Longimicrobium terrae]